LAVFKKLQRCQKSTIVAFGVQQQAGITAKNWIGQVIVQPGFPWLWARHFRAFGVFQQD
jgi:hypothetical protein